MSFQNLIILDVVGLNYWTNTKYQCSHYNCGKRLKMVLECVLEHKKLRIMAVLKCKTHGVAKESINQFCKSISGMFSHLFKKLGVFET